MDSVNLTAKAGPPLVSPHGWIWAPHAIEDLVQARWPESTRREFAAAGILPTPGQRDTRIVHEMMARMRVGALHHLFIHVLQDGREVKEDKPLGHWSTKAGVFELVGGGDFPGPGGRRGIFAYFRHLYVIEQGVDEIAAELRAEADRERGVLTEYQDALAAEQAALKAGAEVTSPRPADVLAASSRDHAEGETGRIVDDSSTAPAPAANQADASTPDTRAQEWLERKKPAWGSRPPGLRKAFDNYRLEEPQPHIKRDHFNELFKVAIGKRGRGQRRIDSLG